MNRQILWSLVCFCLAAVPATAQIPAFPGAEGAGAFATGGRPVEKINFFPTPTMPVLEKRGVVYHVTTLAGDPSGVIPGSLRYGLRTENWWYRTHPFRELNVDDPDSFDVTPRIIVFDVGGTINMGEVDISPMNFTIAGQTAPGGITIYGGEFNPGHREAWDNGGVYPDKTNNMVLRNFAIRTNDANEKDGLWIPATNSIADHLSMSWYTDEGVSITDSVRNVTVQHSIVGPGWNNPDGDGSQIEGKTPMADISVHHNLYLHNDARIPRVGEKTFTSGGPGVELDFRNNVIYNWNDGRVGYGVSGENSFSNFVNNYYIGGAGSGSTTILDVPGGDAGLTHRVYQNGNLMDQNRNGAADGTDLGWSAFLGGEAQQGSPYAVPHGVTQSPAETLETVKNYAGSRWWDRDFLDERAINQLMTFGNSALPVSQRGQVLSSIDPADVNAVANAPMQTHPDGWDTDNDGMPNFWEEVHGLNPDSPTNDTDWNLDFDDDGYINVEEYINEIAEWPAPYDIIFSGGTNNRYAQITNWGITRPSPNEGNTTTNWQPSRFDVAVVNNSTVVVDAVGQHAGKLLLGTNSGDNATLNITAGRLEVEDKQGPGNGEIVIGAHASAAAALNLSGGELIAETLSKGAGDQFNFTGGRLQADLVNFNLVNNGGTVAPGNLYSITQVNGSFSTNSGSLEIELDSDSGYEAVWAALQVVLGGDLEVLLVDGFVPENDDRFTIVVGGDMSGVFDNLSPQSRIDIANGEGSFLVTIGANEVVLSDFSLPSLDLAGDYNDDGTVDINDYTVWRDNLGGISLANETASLGIVDGEDYDAWKANFGASSGSGAGANQAVPEPATMFSAILGILYLVSMASVARRRYSP